MGGPNFLVTPAAGRPDPVHLSVGGGMCLGKMKTCLLPTVALCLLLVPLVGEWLLCSPLWPSGRLVHGRALL